MLRPNRASLCRGSRGQLHHRSCPLAVCDYRSHCKADEDLAWVLARLIGIKSSAVAARCHVGSALTLTVGLSCHPTTSAATLHTLGAVLGLAVWFSWWHPLSGVNVNDLSNLALPVELRSAAWRVVQAFSWKVAVSIFGLQLAIVMATGVWRPHADVLVICLYLAVCCWLLQLLVCSALLDGGFNRSFICAPILGSLICVNALLPITLGFNTGLLVIMTVCLTAACTATGHCIPLSWASTRGKWGGVFGHFISSTFGRSSILVDAGLSMEKASCPARIKTVPRRAHSPNTLWRHRMATELEPNPSGGDAATIRCRT
jgi:hypothetical protein